MPLAQLDIVPSGRGRSDTASYPGGAGFTEQLREARKDRLYEKIFGVYSKSATVGRASADNVELSDRLSLRR